LRFRTWLLVLALISIPGRAQQQLPVPDLHLPQPSPPAPAPGQTPAQPAASAPPPANMPGVKISAKIEPFKVHQGEVFDYLVELSWEKSKESCELEFKLPVIPTGEKIKAVGSEFESENLAKAETENVRRIYRFKYFPMAEGKQSLAQADFEYRCRGTETYYQVSAPPFPVEVLKKKIHLKDIVRSRHFRIFLLVALLAGVVSSAILLIRSRRKKAELAPAPVEKTPEENALLLLTNADQYRIAGRYPDYFLGLEQALRKYLEEKYQIRWSGRERLVDEVSKATAPDLASELDYFLKFSDRVKFAGAEPASSELDRCYQAVRRVIEFKKMEIAGGMK